MIELRDVTFTYSDATRPALRDLNLRVPQGQICVVVGRSGAGKSTLCALLGGFVPQFFGGVLRGEVLVDGISAPQSGPTGLAGRLGFVTSDSFSQISGTRFTVAEEIAFGLENLGYERGAMLERIEWVLDALDLRELRDRSPYALSGGQQQRLVLASALAPRPSLLLLDEPSSALDPDAADRLAALLRRLVADGTTLLVAEQRLDWAAGLAQRVLVLDEGALIADGPPEVVLRDPLLLERGIGWPRITMLAAAAREVGAWPAVRPLPVTLAGWPIEVSSSPVVVPQPINGVRLPTVTEHQSLLVRVEQVSFRYPSGVEALRNVALNLYAGERVAIVGRNGAGKSTLVRQFNGLLRPTTGRVLYGNPAVPGGSRDIRRNTVAQCARHVGIVFQDVRNQLFARTVRDELRFGPRNLGYAAERVTALVEGALDALGLRGVADDHPYDLTPAQRRLVAIAAVLTLDTPVLVLDEPTVGLDAAATALLAQLVHTLAERGRCVVAISHDLDFCADVLERVVLVQGGAVVLDSRWQALDQQAAALIEEQVALPTSARLSQALGLPLGWNNDQFVSLLPKNL